MGQNTEFSFLHYEDSGCTFYLSRRVHPDPGLYLKDRRITCAEETWFLGLIFDAKLIWVPHLRYIKIACTKAMNLLRILTHTSALKIVRPSSC